MSDGGHCCCVEVFTSPKAKSPPRSKSTNPTRSVPAGLDTGFRRSRLAGHGKVQLRCAARNAWASASPTRQSSGTILGLRRALIAVFVEVGSLNPLQNLSQNLSTAPIMHNFSDIA